ncbi:hypothetical protein J7E80_19160 [Arthrobacter sp. ISL-28]|nr:hypothetical protein [Arthrobacter sp. ISL-28]
MPSPADTARCRCRRTSRPPGRTPSSLPRQKTRPYAANSAGIAAVQGLDAIWIGPSDLSLSLGLPGQSSRPDVDQPSTG